MKNPEYGFKCAGTSRPNLAAGNGLLGCRDEAPKFAGKATELLQRQKSGKWIAENPGRNALFGVVPESCGLRRLDGGGSRAQTEDPPPSHRTGLRQPSRERNFSMQRRRVQIRSEERG